MMTKSVAASGLQLAVSGSAKGSCCRASSAQPATNTPLAKPDSQGQIVQAAAVVVAIHVVAASQFALPEATPPPSGSSQQARFCTFLI